MRKLFHWHFLLGFVKRCYYVRATPIRLLILGIIIVLFIAEVLIYYCTTFSWYTINCKNVENCTKILLAADPQLIGLYNENNKFLTPISIWDSDKYLAKTFSYAFQFTKPDVVILLGDLFDEGSTATDSEFRTYYERLLNIFIWNQHSSTTYIWLPGDNDIGGEGNDWITENKLKRFEHTFQQPSIIDVKNVKFYKINKLTNSLPQVADVPNNLNIGVGLSHIPLLNRGTLFIEEILQTLKPHLLFTAHIHELNIYEATKDGNIQLQHGLNKENKLYQFNLGINKTVYEIVIPTCSYRMGTVNIGFGYAVIENKSIQYTTLWSPDRFLQFRIYQVAMVLFIFSYLIYVCARCSSRIAKKHFQRI